MRRNPFLQPYLSPSIDQYDASSTPIVTKVLEVIYLDTACVLSPLEVPTKVPIYLFPTSPLFTYPLGTRYIWTGGAHETFSGLGLLFHQLLDLGIRGHIEGDCSKFPIKGSLLHSPCNIGPDSFTRSMSIDTNTPFINEFQTHFFV